MTDSNSEDRFAKLRQLAEKRVDIKEIDLTTLTPDAVKQLFHELRTHQIELEIQNEELREAQQALQRSRDALSDLYEFAPVGYATLNSTGIITQANLTLAKMLGVSRGALVGKPLTRFIERVEQDAYYHFLRELQAEPGAHTIELKVVTLNHDNPLYVQIHTFREENNGGDPQFFRLAFVDVTARRGAEAALYAAYNNLEQLVALRTAELRESEERFRSMADSAPVMIWVADEDGQRTFVNQTWQTFTGRDVKEDIGEAWLELVHPDDTERVTTAYWNAIRADRLFRLEYRLLRNDGEYRWVLEVGVPTHSEGASAGFVGSAIDITERKEAQYRLEKALANSRELYRISRHISTLSTPRDILRTLVESRYLSDCSRATIVVFSEPWDYEPPQSSMIIADWQAKPNAVSLLDRSFDLDDYRFYALCRRDAPVVVSDVAADSRVNRPLKDALKEIGTRSLLVYPLVASGKWFGVLVLHAEVPYDADDDMVMHIRGLVDQVAAALHTTQQLSSEAQARRLAEEANHLKIRFLAMISHELRTPLTSIQGYADTLLMDDVTWDAEQQQDFIETIRDESENLRELIEQLLDLSRLEAGMFSIDTSLEEGKALLEEAYQRVQVVAPQHDLTLDIEGDLPSVMVDRQRIEQVLTNLVHNSAKFSPVGSSIIVEGRANEHALQISVSDEGPGIPKQEHEQVFEAFRQAGKQELMQGGAGLGLAICRGIVQAHGGEIWIENKENPGLSVAFSIPAYSESD